MRILLFITFCLVALGVQARTTNYIRQGASGTGTGADWANALPQTPTSWTRDRIYYVAGDSLNGPSFTSSSAPVNGTQEIWYKKATIADHGTSVGWSDSYASGPTYLASGISSEGNGADSSYCSVDGSYSYGFIRIVSTYNSSGIFAINYNATPVKRICITNCEFRGLSYGQDCYFWPNGVFQKGMDSATYYGGYEDWVISRCKFEGFESVFHLANQRRIIIEHCDISRSCNSNPDINNSAHPNVFYAQLCHGSHFRYNWVHKWEEQGWYPFAVNSAYAPVGVYSNWCYGNVFSDGLSSVANAIMPSYGDHYDSRVFNNTVYNIGSSMVVRVAFAIVQSGFFSNNLVYWSGTAPNVSGISGYPVRNKNWYSGASALSESHSIAAGSINPFGNAPTSWDIVSTVGALYPRDKGGIIGAGSFAIDRGGVTRGADGLWDIGAHEVGTAAPVIGGTLTVTGYVGTAFSYFMTVSGGATAYGYSNLPSGLTFSGVTGELYGTPSGSPATTTVTMLATNVNGNDIEYLSVRIEAAAAIGSLSSSNLIWPVLMMGRTNDLTLTITNTGASTLTGTFQNPSSPWTLIGTASYSLAQGATHTATLRASPTTYGRFSGTVEATGGAIALTCDLSVDAYADIGTGTNYAAVRTLVDAPFSTNGNILQQFIETLTPGGGGRAVYGFTLATDSIVTIGALAETPSQGNNSFFAVVDGVIIDPLNIWDIPTLVTGYSPEVLINYRGDGPFDNPQFQPITLYLAAGDHELILEGRENQTRLSHLCVHVAVQSAPLGAAPLAAPFHFYLR